MFSTPQTIFKLMILYFLDSVDFPLSNAIISKFMLEQGYADYFKIQTAFSELEAENFISSSGTHKTTYYEINEDGKKALDCFYGDLSKDLKEKITAYLKSNYKDILEALSTVSDYSQTASNDYLVTCQLKERNSLLASLQLIVPDEKTAQLVCHNWTEKNDDIYMYLINKLTQRSNNKTDNN